METNKTDNIFKKAFKTRTIEPSISSWDRLNTQLDNHEEKKKKKPFVYFSYAASILLIVSLGIYFSQEANNQIQIKKSQEVVHVKENNFSPKTQETPVFEAITDKIKTIHKNGNNNNNITIKTANIKEISIPIIIKKELPILTEIILTEVDTSNIYQDQSLMVMVDKKIKVDPKSLLQALENEEKLILTKEEKQKIIKTELSKRKLNLDPTVLLAEIERDIDNSSFKEKFMKSLKYNIENFATVFNERNN